jgi:RNA polymerase sigma-70 factor, ECF subfamily
VWEQRFEEFFAHDYARLVAAVGLAVGNPDAARDAVDEALARAWELRRKDEIESLAGWVRVVAMNVARTEFRRRSAELRATQRMMARTPRDDAMLVDGADAVDVARAMAKLSRRQREIIVLHYFLDLSVRDIAAELHMSEGGVKACLHRGRASLEAVLESAVVRP